MTIEVDAQAAEILRRVSALAEAKGETLGAYLEQVLPAADVPEAENATQAKAWRAFVEGASALVAKTLPSGHFVDDSRESMYDDRA
jgi:hypothetical protein